MVSEALHGFSLPAPPPNSTQTHLPTSSRWQPHWLSFFSPKHILLPLNTGRFPFTTDMPEALPHSDVLPVLENACWGWRLSAGRIPDCLGPTAFLTLVTGRNCLRSSWKVSEPWPSCLQGVLPKLDLADPGDRHHSPGNCKWSWRVKFWACRPKHVTCSDGHDERILSFGLGCSLSFQTQREEQSLCPMLTVLHSFLSPFNYREHTFWMRYWNAWLDAWPNNGS